MAFEAWLLFKLVVISSTNFKPKGTAAASCGFHATVRLSCFIRHEMSAVSRPIAAKLCHMIGSGCNFKTRNILDCDQSNYSSRIIFCCRLFLQAALQFMKVDRITHPRYMVIRNFPRWRPAAILDLVQPEVSPFDPPTSKTLP